VNGCVLPALLSDSYTVKRADCKAMPIAPCFCRSDGGRRCDYSRRSLPTANFGRLKRVRQPDGRVVDGVGQAVPPACLCKLWWMWENFRRWCTCPSGAMSTALQGDLCHLCGSCRPALLTCALRVRCMHLASNAATPVLLTCALHASMCHWSLQHLCC
jgi:hypothetical protein